tara:strand:- start:233 stop:472 length:240 start_codon:yes stop_codon:yes gene_type:complete
MINFKKDISVGNIVTSLVFLGTLIFGAGQFLSRIESLEKQSKENEYNIEETITKVASMESKIDYIHEDTKWIKKHLRND